jgi:flagellar basal-body rod protein FlgB
MSMLDSALGLHGKALSLRNQRMEVLARNIANADTPSYKARDLDFKQILQQASADKLQTTNAQHLELPPMDEHSGNALMYRIPFNAAFDGNTVELNVEQAQYGKAAADYQATLGFLENKVSGLRKALRGE